MVRATCSSLPQPRSTKRSCALLAPWSFFLRTRRALSSEFPCCSAHRARLFLPCAQLCPLLGFLLAVPPVPPGRSSSFWPRALSCARSAEAPAPHARPSVSARISALPSCSSSLLALLHGRCGLTGVVPALAAVVARAAPLSSPLRTRPPTFLP
jgi:hypothetical protein